MNRASGFLLLLLSVSIVAQPASADWPGFRGNSQLTGVATDALTDAPELLWTAELGIAIESTAAIVGGRAYVGTIDSTLHAVDVDTGKPVWSYRAADAIKSSPLVQDGRVYFGDETGVFHAVDAETGKGIWTFESEGGIISPAVRVGTSVLFGSYDNSLYSLNAETGEQRWTLLTEGYVHAAPTALGDTSVVVSGCDALLHLVDVATGEERSTVPAGAYVAASTAVVGSRAYVGTFGNNVIGVDLEAGGIIWDYSNPKRQFPFYASPAVLDSVLVIGGRDRLVHAVHTTDGTGLWTHQAGARVDASPVIFRNPDGTDRVVYASLNGRLEILDLATGESVWLFETGSGFSASPAVANGRLVIGSDEGVLFGFGSKN